MGKKRSEKMGHTIDDTSGSSGFGFSIKSYIAMITDCQPSSVSSGPSSLSCRHTQTCEEERTK
jgi:hypothetical protein